MSQGSNPAARTLRDMSTPEGVVTKSGGNYYYKYFLRDYLGNVRDVLSCSKSGGYQEEQFTNYDPLGLAISKIGGDNPYLYNGKELYSDFSDAYEGVYDFGARYYNPLYGRWFAPDPEKQHPNPYIYCGNNPVMLLDPDGRKFRWPWIFQFWLQTIQEREDAIRKSEDWDKIFEILNNKDAYTQEKIDEAKRKYDEYNESLKLLRQDRENLIKMNDDKNLYLLKKVAPETPANIYKNDKGDITVEYSSEGVFAHERVHVVQWLDDKNGEFMFNDRGILVHINNTNDYGYEAQAYKMQYVYGNGLELPKVGGGTIKAHSITDITTSFVLQIGDRNGNPLYGN